MPLSRPPLTLTVLLLAAVCRGLPVDVGDSGLEHIRPGLSVYRAYGRARSLQQQDAALTRSEAHAVPSSQAVRRPTETESPPETTSRGRQPISEPASSTAAPSRAGTAAQPTSVEPELVIQETPTGGQQETQPEPATTPSASSGSSGATAATDSAAAAAAGAETENGPTPSGQPESATVTAGPTASAESVPTAEVEQTQNSPAEDSENGKSPVSSTSAPAEAVEDAADPEEDTQTGGLPELTNILEDSSVDGITAGDGTSEAIQAVSVEAVAKSPELTVSTSVSGVPDADREGVAGVVTESDSAEDAKVEQAATVATSSVEEEEQAQQPDDPVEPFPGSVGAVEQFSEPTGSGNSPAESAVSEEPSILTTGSGEASTEAEQQLSEERKEYTVLTSVGARPGTTTADVQQITAEEDTAASTGLAESPQIPGSEPITSPESYDLETTGSATSPQQGTLEQADPLSDLL